MKYYKIILQQTFIGIANSNNFLTQNPISHWLISANEVTGQYVECNNALYRDYWMTDVNNSLLPQFSYATVEEITKEEYDIYAAAIEKEEEIIVPDPHEHDIIPIIPDEEEIPELEYVRAVKIKEMSYECNKTIEEGFDLEMEDGTHHYSYALEDQLNLMNLSSMIAQGINELSYHADGELCRFYTPAEINGIIDAGNKWKTYHTTYFNALKSYINSLETIEEISAITYGIEIPEAFKTDVLKILEY